VSKKLLVIAGEASGDLHGSSLIKELLKIDKSIEIYGIGGDKMTMAGMTPQYHINQMSFLGFFEILKHLPFIKKVKKKILHLVKEKNIKNVVLIDYPGFNLSISKSFYKMRIKPIYFISPQIWAWGKGRLKKIKKYISRLIVLFPFEKKMYELHDVTADFVGHPLIQSLHNHKFLTREELIKKYDLNSEQQILLLLPGSRNQELDKILPETLEAAEKLRNKFNLQTVIACADNISEEYFNDYSHQFKFKLIKGVTYDLLKNSKLAIVKSGTSTLEAGIIGTPFIVVYKTNIITYLIGKALIKINNIALANIVAEETIVPELIQHDVNPDRIFSECSDILKDENKYNEFKLGLSKIKNKLETEGNPSKKAAEIIYTELIAQRDE
jgi:lipid-A-disaccharide synthase